MEGLGGRLHFFDVREQVLLCFNIDDGTDVGGKLHGFADDQFVHRAFDDVDHAIGHVFLHAQDAQG